MVNCSAAYRHPHAPCKGIDKPLLTPVLLAACSPSCLPVGLHAFPCARMPVLCMPACRLDESCIAAHLGERAARGLDGDTTSVFTAATGAGQDEMDGELTSCSPVHACHHSNSYITPSTLWCCACHHSCTVSCKGGLLVIAFPITVLRYYVLTRKVKR